MLASRPSTSASSALGREERAGTAPTAVPLEEKQITGDERKPLLDLDDVEQLENELAACFDAPPPPPLNMHRHEPTATVSSWTPSADSRLVEDLYDGVPPSSGVRYLESEEQRQLEQLAQLDQQAQQQSSRVSDFSSLYLPAPERTTSFGQLYPALVPTAPSTEVKPSTSTSVQIPTAYAPTRQAQSPPATAAPAAAAAVAAATAPTMQAQSRSAAEADYLAGSAAAATAAAGLAAAAVRGHGLARAARGDTAGEVVEELLSENERLRLIIEEMSQELESVSKQLQERGPSQTTSATAAAAATAASRSSSSASGTRGSSTQPNRAAASAPSTSSVSAPASAPASESRSQHLRYPGAAAEAARRRREAEQRRSAAPRRGTVVHFKCEACPQWLKVPAHAQLVYCPTCSHTSQMTDNSIIHHPPENATSQSNGDSGAEADPSESWFSSVYRRLIPS